MNVLTTTGCRGPVSIVLAVEAGAVAVGGLGGLATRLGARQTMLICDGVRAPLIAAGPLLHVAGLLGFPLLLLLVFGVGLFATPSFASKTALLPDLFPDDEVRLGEVEHAPADGEPPDLRSRPAIAGVLIGVFGATSCCSSSPRRSSSGS